MRRALAILLLLTSIARASNEIRAFAPGVTTAYAVVREADGDVWYVSGQVFEAWGTGGRTAADYDIALTDKSGDMFVGDFDTNVSAGSYTVATHYQSGGSPADADPVVWAEDGYWTGSAWIAAGQAGTLNDIVTDTSELQTDWADGGRLDVILDAVKAMTDLTAVVSTTVAVANDANNFTITAGQDVNDAYDWHAIMVEDAGDSHSEVRWIEDYQTSRDVTVDEPFSFTPAASDKAWILGPVYGGYLWEISRRLGTASIPVHYYDQSGGGATGGAGGTSYYDQSGDDP